MTPAPFPEASPLAHEFVTLEEIAERCGYALGTIRRWAYNRAEFPTFPPAIARLGRQHIGLFDFPLAFAWIERHYLALRTSE